MLGAHLNTLHNLHYYQHLMKRMRDAIRTGELANMDLPAADSAAE